VIPDGLKLATFVHAHCAGVEPKNNSQQEMTMSNQPASTWRMPGLVLALALLVHGQAVAADVKQLRTRALAATCAHCHGTDGRALEGEATAHLAGMSKEYLYTQLLAFRTGQRPATIMHQITKGYSQEQLEEIAAYFSAVK
jgi:cytochrome c553